MVHTIPLATVYREFGYTGIRYIEFSVYYRYLRPLNAEIYVAQQGRECMTVWKIKKRSELTAQGILPNFHKEPNLGKPALRMDKKFRACERDSYGLYLQAM